MQLVLVAKREVMSAFSRLPVQVGEKTHTVESALASTGTNCSNAGSRWGFWPSSTGSVRWPLGAIRHPCPKRRVITLACGGARFCCELGHGGRPHATHPVNCSRRPEK